MRITGAVIITWLLCAFACGDQDDGQDPVRTSLAPVALDRQLVFVDGAQQRAYVIDVARDRPSADARPIELPFGANSAERRLLNDEALILCAGQRGSLEVEAEQAALVAIDGGGEKRTYELGTTPFNALAQSDDGRYAILFQRGAQSGRTLSNPNELVVVDLELDPDAEGAVTRKTPDGLGHPLEQVLVSPSMSIAGEGRRLLVVLSAAEVTLFDLNHLDRRATIVQLDESRSVNPVQVLFSASNPSMFVRANDSDNVFMLRFEPHDNDPEGNDFRPTINLISGGAGPRDIALYGEGIDMRLLVVAQGDNQALVIDPSSSKSIALRLGAPASLIQLFTARSPDDGEEHTQAILYSLKQSSLTFLDLAGLGDEPQDQLELLQVGNPINGLIALLPEQEVVLLHDRGVSLLRLGERTLTPIMSAQTLTAQPVFDREHKRLWIGPDGESWIGTVDLGTGRTDEVLLDARVHGLIPMYTAQRLVVLHASDIGYLTLLDLERPSRDDALSLRGFFISGSLDRSR